MQEEKYKKRVLPGGRHVRIAIEAGVKDSWYKWLLGERGREANSGFVGMSSFGASAPANSSQLLERANPVSMSCRRKTAMACGLGLPVGCDPAENALNALPPSCRNTPSAIKRAGRITRTLKNNKLIIFVFYD